MVSDTIEPLVGGNVMYKKCVTEESAMRQQHIIQVFIDMMQTKTINEISVIKLCERANIPRKAFYRYFETKDDLIYATLDLFHKLYQSYTRERRKQDATIEYHLTLFFTFWYEHSPFIQAMKHSNLLYLFLTNFVQEVWNERKGDRITAYFAMTGLYGVLLEWENDGFSQTPTEIAHRMMEIFTNPLSNRLFME